MPADELFDVAGEIVVITGVGGQLGAQYARAFLVRGARVVGVDLREGATTEELRAAAPERFEFVAADVVERRSLVQVLERTMERFGTPSVLVNNAALDTTPSAGVAESGPFEAFPETAWDIVLEVNLKGVFLCCQVFGAAMARAGRGSIVNISSIYGLVSPDQSIYEYRRTRGEEFYKPVAYSASKAGILNLTRYVATYWARRGVRANTLTLAGVFNHQDEQFLERYCARIPIGRMADVTEYDGAVLFLASSASRYMTGANLIVDGGWTAI